MFRKILTLIVSIVWMSVAFAQSTFTVTVVDVDQNPIGGVTVNIGNERIATNGNGQAVFQDLESRIYRLEIVHVGYETFSERIDVASEEAFITLIPAMLFTGEVFVSATRAKENASTTYRNIGKEDIRKANLGQDIPYLLDQTPGVVIGSDAGNGIGYTNMTVRGSDNTRINVSLNGIPLNDAESMGSFFVNLPDFASSVQSIQVQRGVGTSTNGAGAFGASLNIQTDALETKPYAELNNSFGSFNSMKNTVKVGSGLINDKYAFNARLSRIQSDGYVERASSNLKSFYLDGGLYTEKHVLKGTVFSGQEKTYQSWYGTPQPLVTGNRGELEDYAQNAFWLYDGPEYDRLMNADRRYNYYTYDNQTDNYTQTHSHLHYTYTANDKFYVNAALHYTRGAGYYEEFKGDDDLFEYNLAPVVLGGEVIESSDIIRRLWLDNHFYGATYSANYNAKPGLNFTLGGAYNEYKGDHYGEVVWARYASDGNIRDRYYENDATKKDFNIYGKMDYQVEDLLINVDLQYRNVNYVAKGPDDEFLEDGSRRILDFHDNLNFFNPKAGLTYFLSSQSNVYASYAFANKEPIRKDYVENPLGLSPKPERMQNVEAGYRFRGEILNVGANFYGMFYKDQLILTGQLNDVGSAIRQNVDQSYRIGAELDAAWQVTPQFVWKATAAFSDNKIIDFIEYVDIYDGWDKVGVEEIHYDKTNIAMSANTIVSNDLTYSPVKPLSFSLMSKYVSRLFLDNSGSQERSIDPSFVNNLRALYSTAFWGLERVDFNLSVNNVFNAKYQTNGYTFGSLNPEGVRSYYNFYYPQATANFMFGLNVRF